MCRNLVHTFGPNTLAMYVPNDPVIYIDKVVQLCTQKKQLPSNNHHHDNKEKEREREEPLSTDESSCDEGQVPESGGKERETVPWRSLFILIPMRLGVDKINPMYLFLSFFFFSLPPSAS